MASLRRFSRPAIVVILSEFCQRIGEEVSRQIEARLGRLPGHVQQVDAVADLSGLRPALTRALNLRNARDSSQQVRWKAVEVILVAAAADLTSVAPFAEAIEILRAEFDRTCLDGRIGLYVYVGPTPHNPVGPAPDLLFQLDQLEGFDYALAQSDADALGRRASHDDAVLGAALTLYYLIADERVRKCLAVESPLVSAADRRFSCGVRRLRLDERPIHAAVYSHLKTRLFECLFHSGTGSGRSVVPLPREGLSAEGFNPQWGLDGSVAGIEQTIESNARERSEELEKCLVHEAADRTRNQLLKLIRPPSLGWFARFIQWLMSLIRRLLSFIWRKRETADVAAPPCSAPIAKDLLGTETMYIKLKSLEWALKPTGSSDALPALSSPLDLALVDLPGIREAALARLPAAEDLAGQLARTLPFRELLAEADDPHTLCARLDALCRDALALHSHSRLFSAEDYQPWIIQLAKQVCAFVPGYVHRPCRLLLHDPDLPPIADLDDFVQDVGDRDEVVAFEFARGLSFERLARQGSENGKPSPAPVSK